jgi:cytochrome c oxidase assembly protein subunit 15
MSFPDSPNRSIAIWLLACCVLIFAMVVVGGATRLTRSGLSIVEWKPITGVVPPIGEQAWQQEFEKYRQYPEYQKINRGMTLHEFKSIYWWEFVHRLLGRTIGIVFLLPFLYFLLRGRLRGALVSKTVVMFVLGALQGGLGWYMVKSGLVDRPHVSQYRLTAHLILAFSIYSYMLWVAMGLLSPRVTATTAVAAETLRRHALAVTVMVVVMAITGGFVAGTKAGFAFNTFPLMSGQWLPPGYLGMAPWWHNFTENIATIQFNHRWLAIITGLLVLALWWRARGFELDTVTRTALNLLLLLVVIQISLGIATLLAVVPVALGTTHQGGALALLSGALWVSHRLRRQPG